MDHSINRQAIDVWDRNAVFWDQQMGEGNEFHKSLIEPTQLDLLWTVTEGLILSDTDNIADLTRYFDHNPGMSHVALRAREVVGAVLCGLDGRRGYLHHLAVASEERHQGIGRALVNACLSKLRDAGVRQCNLFVIDDHIDGRRFWTSDGWGEWPQIRLMSKKIEDSSDGLA